MSSYLIRPQRYAGTPSLLNALLAASPIFLLRLDDASSPYQDATAHNFDGTTVGGVTAQHLAGPDGHSYPDFNGSTGHLTVTNDATTAAVGGMTWFFIIKPDITTLQFPMDKETNPQYEWSVRIGQTNAGEIRLTTITPAGVEIRNGVTAGSIVSTSIWNVIAITIDSTPSNTSTITINHNGSWKSVTHSGSGGTYSQGTTTVLVGGRGDGPNQKVDGHMAYACLLPKCSAATVDGFMASADLEGWF